MTFMKRTTPALLFAALLLAALISCKKDESSSETTTTTTTSSTPVNPLLSKACTGIGLLMTDSVTDTLLTKEAIMAPLNLYGIYGTSATGSFTMQSGSSKLPVANTTFTISGDPDKFPSATQMIVEYYDDHSSQEYYATSGSVSYTVSTAEKTVTLTNITFKSNKGDSKILSFKATLK